MVDGFLGRWSKRKLDGKDGKPLAPEPDLAIATQVAVPAVPTPASEPVAEPEAPPPLTLEDAQALTPESDFRPFAARGVAPEVQNAAMKKLFSDAEEKEEAEQAAAAAAAAREVADNPTSQTVAQSAAAPAVPSAPSNDDPDLRLQQDHAPPGEAPGGGAA